MLTDRRVIALAVARMADSIGNSFLIVVLPLYIASGTVKGGSFGLSVSVITGLILAMFGLLNSASQPFVGRFSDRVGKRKVFVLGGLAILAVTNFVYSYATSYPTLILIRAIQGIGVALTITATIALVNELASDDSRGGNMGIFNTFRLIGFGAGPIGAGALVNGGPYNWPVVGPISGFDAAFYLASATAVVSFVLVTLLVSDPEQTSAEAGDDLSVELLADDADHTIDPVFALGIASLFMAMGIALLSAIEPLVNNHLDQTSFLFGVEFAAFVAAQVLLQVPIGWASDRWGRRPFILAGLTLLIPATAAQGFVDTSMGMIVARFVQGAAAAAVFAPSLALAGDIAKSGNSGTQLSILTMSFGLGTALGPLATGALVHYGYQVPFEFGAALAVVGLALVYTQVTETVGDATSGSGASAGTSQD